LVTISAGATIAHGNLDDRADRCTAVALGSGLPRGLRQLPLIQIHLGQVVSLDAYANIAYSLDDGSVTETYQLGATIAW
jgi:co-chaperonin GroES (HSP10)